MRSFYVFLALVATAVAQYNNYTFPPGFNPNLISLTDRGTMTMLTMMTTMATQ